MCFLCKKEGHIRKNCPIINKKNNEPSQGKFADGNFGSRELVIIPDTLIPNRSFSDSHSGKGPDKSSFINPIAQQPITSNQRNSLKDNEGFQTVKNKKPRKKSAQQLATDQIRATSKSNPFAALASPTQLIENGPSMDSQIYDINLLEG